jgi:hypothetical protein
MKKVCLFRVLCLWLFLIIGSWIGVAQSHTPRWEIGPQISVLKLNYHFRGTEGTSTKVDDYWLGFGGRVTFNLNDHFALDGSLEKFNSDNTDKTLFMPSTFNTAAQPDSQGLFGVKMGARREKYGIFAKVRPGFTRYTPVPTCTSISITGCSFIQDTSFSLDVGGVFEGYISRRIMYRGDAGFIQLRHRETTLFFPGEPGTSPFFFNSQGFKKFVPNFSIGIGIRF